MAKKVILLCSVLLLFSACIYKTYDILAINSKEETVTEEIIEKTDLLEVDNNSNTNTYQDEDTAMRLFDGKYIYYNTSNYLMKYDIYTSKSEPLLAGVPMKCLTDAGNDIYGVTTMMNGEGIDCDYLIKVSKDTGNTTVFYKTECPHITSVSFDGTYAYYTNESHPIYRLDGNETVVFEEGKKKADYPVIIGISDDFLYYADGTQIEAIDINTRKKTFVNGQLCSINQNPILNNGYIYMFGDFGGDIIISVNLSTNEIKEIISKDFINKTARADKINSFSVTDNMLVFNCEGRLYVKDLRIDEKAKFLKYVNSIESSSFDKYVFTISDEKVDVLEGIEG